MRRRKMRFQGKEIDVLDLDFEVGNEAWNEYKLLDGGSVRLKTSALRIVWVLDDKGNRTFTNEGDPNIIVNHATNVVCTAGG